MIQSASAASSDVAVIQQRATGSPDDVTVTSVKVSTHKRGSRSPRRRLFLRTVTARSSGEDRRCLVPAAPSAPPDEGEGTPQGTSRLDASPTEGGPTEVSQGKKDLLCSTERLVSTEGEGVEDCRQLLDSLTLRQSVADSRCGLHSEQTAAAMETGVKLSTQNRAKALGNNKKGGKRVKCRPAGGRRLSHGSRGALLDVLLVEGTQQDKQRQKKGQAKRLAHTAGQRVLKGLRVGCKFLWSGLVLYTKPFGSMDEARVWEERHEADRLRCRLDCLCG